MYLSHVIVLIVETIVIMAPPLTDTTTPTTHTTTISDVTTPLLTQTQQTVVSMANLITIASSTPPPLTCTSAFPPLSTTSGTLQSSTVERDSKVGWVYHLSKVQLLSEMEKMGLDLHGNVQELRARYVNFLRVGNANQYEPSLTTTTTALQEEAAAFPEGLPPTTLSISSHLHHGPIMSTRESESTRAQEMYYLSNQQQHNFLTSAPTYQQTSCPDPSINYSRPLNIMSGITDRHEVSTESLYSSHSAQICAIVRKWGLNFDGKKYCPISFLERLDELTEAYHIKPDDMLKALPEIFRGTALLWFRNTKHWWTNLEEFREYFKAQFFPPGYELSLDEEVRRRTQGLKEPFRDFVTALSTLMRRRGQMTTTEMLDRIYQNMRPEYKLIIRRKDFQSLPSLMSQAEEYESYLRAQREYRPPPSPAQALIPETAYNGPKEKSNTWFTSKVTQFNDPNTQKRTPDKEQMRSASKTFSQEPPSQTNESYVGRSPQRPQTNSHMYEKTNPQANLICWNCSKTGHLFRDCEKPKVLRCFYCKAENTRTTTCNCRQGNEKRGQNL